MHDPYQQIGHFYDDIVGERRDVVKHIKALIKKHAGKAKSLLEVACGTGINLEAFASKYSVTGLDLSETMLSQAAQKLPGVPLFQADMSSFSLDHQFDVVLCIYDSINHLNKISIWKKAFRSIRSHLEDGGIFIFDMNTLYKLEKLSSEQPIVHEFDGSTYILDVEKKGKNRFNWNARIFYPCSQEHFSCVEDTIPETAYPLTKVKELLKPYFKILSINDFDQGKRSPKSERLYFVCKAI